MNESTLNNETIIVENSTGSAIAGDVTYDSATRTVTFDPTANLEYNETYNVTITTGVADLAGNNMASEFRWNFTTEAEWMPTADNLGVEDATGRSGSYATVPVNIMNVRNGPVQSIRIRVDYNESVLNLTSISEGDLTLNWTHLRLGEDRHTMTIATSYTGDAIPDGSSGSVVLLNFHVIGSPGDKSPMNLSLIELSNPYGEVGTAPAKNGTLTVKPSAEQPTPTPTPSLGGGGGGGGGGYVPTTPTPTEKPPVVAISGTKKEKAAVTPAPATPAPTITPPSTAPTPAPTPAPVPGLTPLFLILIVTAVIVIAGIIIIP